MLQLKQQNATPQTVVEVLGNFMRTNYGAEALHEAERHVMAYNEEAQHELAGIWLCVVEKLKSSEPNTAPTVKHGK